MSSGDAERRVWARQFDEMNAQIRDRGALRTDVDGDGEAFSWVDEAVMGEEFLAMYTKMTSLGYARGWL